MASRSNLPVVGCVRPDERGTDLGRMTRRARPSLHRTVPEIEVFAASLER